MEELKTNKVMIKPYDKNIQPFNKKIVLKDGSVIIAYFTDEAYCGSYVSIQKCYLEESKNFVFSMWDDFSFKAYSKDRDSIQNMEFSINIDDPLYFPFANLLEYKNPIIIDDDDSYSELKRYMKIEKENYNVMVSFFNYSGEGYDQYKWKVFIKNICSDPRSKIKDNNIKYSLINFFREIKEMFGYGYYQMNVDNCLEIKEYNDKMKKLEKKI